ncbi:MAG: hypothetical protein NVSMB26_21080 [Beijerinckiaceae bacterium]
MRLENPDAAIIRKGRLSDLDRLVAIEIAAFAGDRLSRRTLRAHLTNASVSLLVAEVEKESFAHIVGYALIGFRKTSQKARLYSIATDREHRRGFGRQLLEACEAEAVARGATSLILEVRSDNAPAIALYDARGYMKRGMLSDYYEDGASALRYEKRLI